LKRHIERKLQSPNQVI
jgi:hypothetical protein